MRWRRKEEVEEGRVQGGGARTREEVSFYISEVGFYECVALNFESGILFENLKRRVFYLVFENEVCTLKFK